MFGPYRGFAGRGTAGWGAGPRRMRTPAGPRNAAGREPSPFRRTPSPPTGGRGSELDLPDRVLDLADDRVAQVLAPARLVALHRRDDPGHDEGDEQDQGHVLDGALTDLGRES